MWLERQTKRKVSVALQQTAQLNYVGSTNQIEYIVYAGIYLHAFEGCVCLNIA